MASMRDIKRRRISIQNTQQITKAMKLVSTVRLQRAKSRAEKSRAYFRGMRRTVASMLSRTGSSNVYLSDNGSSKRVVVVISSNRGLAGGFNGNVVKLLLKNPDTADWKSSDTGIYAIGNKAREALARHGFEIIASDPDIIEEPLYSDAVKVTNELLSRFRSGEIGEIYVAYTEFKNTVTHIPTLIRVLPIEQQTDDDEEAPGSDVPMNYEPAEDEALELIIPKYVASMIFGALTQSIASENGARMQAMDSATSNAEDMIQSLSLQYNRARQGSITQELTEIIAGAEAIS